MRNISINRDQAEAIIEMWELVSSVELVENGIRENAIWEVVNEIKIKFGIPE